MAHRRDFDIAFVGLKPGNHEFFYELGNDFFAEMGATDITNANATVKLTLGKNTGFMLLKFEIGGKTDVTCDRCGNPLTMQLWDDFNMVVKMVDNPQQMNDEEEDADVFYISRTESHLHVKNWIYEFVMLSLPMQRMCPPEEMGGSQCNKEVLDMLEKMEKDTEQHNANSLWKGLDKFKDN